ncbi:MAG: hypothetical protein ACI9QD_000906 [Thermoproteota archaeon]|jgi:hypothetical protein
MKMLVMLTMMILQLNFTNCFADSSLIPNSINNQKRLINLYSGFTYNSTTVDTTASSSTTATSSNLSSMGVTIAADYFFKDKYSITTSYYISFITDIDSEVDSLNIGVKYYFNGIGYKQVSNIFGNIIKTSPKFAPYVYAGYNAIKFQFSNYSINFKGLKLAGGVDWHFSNNYFARGNLFYQSSTNSSQRSLTNVGLSIGIGTSF